MDTGLCAGRLCSLGSRTLGSLFIHAGILCCLSMVTGLFADTELRSTLALVSPADTVEPALFSKTGLCTDTGLCSRLIKVSPTNDLGPARRRFLLLIFETSSYS